LRFNFSHHLAEFHLIENPANEWFGWGLTEAAMGKKKKGEE
jgi:hypothetical protein